MSISENKEFKKFDKNLTNILSSSSGAASWSDLLPFTKEILQLLEKRKDDFDFSYLTDRITLSKRLAQCLNPECPGGVHEVVIKIYTIIFQNILSKNNNKLSDNLGIYSSGLFPFFSYASIANKLIFLDSIVTSCFLKLGQNELSLCLPGLLSSLIPGLDDNNEKTSQKIFSVFDEIKKNMKKGVFYGIYWSLLLRNKSLRASGIKYLYERMIKYNDYNILDNEKKKEILEDEFPDINNLVVNSLCQLIEEQDIPTVRTTMDFIILRLPLSKENTMLSDKAKIILIISALKLLIKNEYSTTRRLSNWLMGTSNVDDEIDLESPDFIYKMDLIVQAFKLMFNSQKLINSENLKNYIKILDQLFTQQIEFADFILSKIAYDLILCFVHFWQKELNSSENVIKNETIKKLNNFFFKDSNYIECLWKSVSNYLDTTQDRTDLEFDKDDYNSTKNVEDFIAQIIPPLKFCFLFLDLQSSAERVKYYIPIINNLLMILNKYEFKDRESVLRIRYILLQTLVFTKSLQGKASNLNVSNTSLTNIVDRKTSLFTQLTEETNENQANETDSVYYISEECTLQRILENKDNEKNISNLNETILNYQNLYIKLLERFFSYDKNSQVIKNVILIFKQSTELMIRLQEYTQLNEIPEWIKNIEKIIFNVDGNMKLSLEASNCLLDLNLSSFTGNEIYQKIKLNFSEKEIDSSMIKDIDSLIAKTGVKKNCQELLMGKLYTILNDQNNQSFQKIIIELLIKISKINETKYINIIENTFNLKENLKDSLKLFSDFWQILNEYYNDYKFFKKGECIFQMVDYLDDEDPFLRHLSKSWLDQSSKQFKQIIEPILLILLEDSIIINESKKDYYIEKEYDTKKIMNSFIKFKNIILNSPIMKFIIENEPSDEIKILFHKKKNLSLDNLDITYFHILISVSLTFTQGKSKENFSETFKKENYSLNASSCEFLEFLLSHVSSPELIMKYARCINLPIVQLLDEAIDNKNEVMQVQLLSVLKVLYFKTSAIHLKHKNDAFLLFSNQSLINCLTKGITRDIFFVRENFINFIREYLPCLKRVMDDEEGKKTYYKFANTFISALTVYLSRRIFIDQKGRKDTDRFSHFDDTNNIRFYIYKNYLDEYKEYKLFDEGDVLLILKGIRDITFHFLNINPNQNKKSPKEFWPEFKNNLIENQKAPSGFLFGLFAVEDEKKNEMDKNAKGFLSSQIMDLLNSLLLTWTNISHKYEPYDYCLNVNGILPFKKTNKEIFTDQDIKHGLEYVRKDPIKNIIKSIAYNLFLANPIEFFQTIIKIWCFSSMRNIKNVDVSIDPQYKLTIIELLIGLDIPLDIILYCINIILIRNIRAEKEKEKKEKKVKYERDKKTKVYHTPYVTGNFEAKFIHFIYSYILLNPFYEIPDIIYSNDQARNEISESWREMINLLNTLISDTKIIYTFCWMYELLQLTLIKFELVKVPDQTVKTKLIDIFNIITEKLTNCVFYNKTDSVCMTEGFLMKPYLPHIYLEVFKEVFIDYPEYVFLLYNKYSDSGQNKKASEDSNLNKKDSLKIGDIKNLDFNKSASINSKVGDFFSIYYSASKLITERVEINASPTSPKELLNKFYREITCITLKDNFYQILMSIYGDANSCRKNMTEIIRQLINMLKINSQDKNEDMMFNAEFASEFLSSLMRDCAPLTTNCGKNMFMDYLNGPNFFNTTPKILQNMRKFISGSVKFYPDILSDLIRNINSGFLFISGSDEDKIKTLRRISFVIYSCEKDTFQKDFDNIQEKAKLFLTGYKDNNKLEAEIFFMLRILFLRFSHEGVMKMIKDLWPIIFAELIENFKNRTRNNQINLLIESFKFIELLSLANVEEFSLYQWIFLLDTFNMKELDTRNPESLLSDLLKKESKIFKPIAVDVIGKEDNINVNDDLIEGRHKGKSELLVCPKNETLEELQNAVKKFFYSIGDMNTYKVELNLGQIENVIENDFIDQKTIKKK